MTQQTVQMQTFQTVSKIALIAGDGELPAHVARNALIQGIQVIPFMISKREKRLQELCQHAGHVIFPGLLRQTFQLLSQERVSHLVFAGKVNKWILLRNPRLDDLAKEALRRLIRLNDDAVMLWLIEQLGAQGISVLPQSAFLQNLFMPESIMSQCKPNLVQLRDAAYGFEMASEMGRLDIGQSIIVHQGMVIAVEAIEGTDECIKRSARWTRKKGGVLIKVAKPEQDQRFDIPTVGLRTLRTMRSVGLNTLVTEADRTLFLEPEAMKAYSNKHQMVLMSTTRDDLEKQLQTASFTES
jgi:UDP-2,3-diacylglucosamine hydrolase